MYRMKSSLFLISLVFLAACASLKDQAKSRELLSKCEYSLERIAIEQIEFDDLVKIAGLAKEVNFKNPGKEVIPLLNEVRKLNFDINFKTLDLTTTVGVTNPNAHKVVVDSIALDGFLDGIRVANVIHDGKAVEVPANTKGEIDLILALPTSYKLDKVLKAEELNLQGKVWLKIELIQGLPITIPFKFNVTKEVPREEIQKLIDEQKNKVLKKVLKELVGGGLNDLLDKF